MSYSYSSSSSHLKLSKNGESLCSNILVELISIFSTIFNLKALTVGLATV